MGVEYANFAFKTFLEENGIIQSMSTKGKSLENRGSEYFFCNIQQELFNTLKHIKWTYEFINREISQYIFRYNNIRIQSNLGYCTPIEYMCKLLVIKHLALF